MKNASSRLLNDYSASASVQNAVVSCEPGYEYKVMPGNPDIKCCKYNANYFYLYRVTLRNQLMFPSNDL